MEKTIKPGRRAGTIVLPASKSDAQRAVLAAALANGTSVLTGWGNSDDERAMRKAVEQLGSTLTVNNRGELVIEGIGEFPETQTLSAGESGLGIRLLTTVCAAHAGNFTIHGEGSLRQRPMDFFTTAFPLFGARCTTDNGNVPLQVSGPMRGAHATVDGSLSSQFVSGLLMALPLAAGESVLEVTDLKSAPYVEMTLQTLNAFGIRITHEALRSFVIPGNQRYTPTQYRIDADWSAASYWLVAAALGHGIQLSGLRSDSLQADKALLGFLSAANCLVTEANGIFSVDGTNRRAFSVDATDCPDLFPALVTLAAYCEGVTEIHGLQRLKHKESDRGLALQAEFGKLGLTILLEDDTMIIHGTGKLNGGYVHSHHDHRIAMCLAIAGLSAATPITVEDAEAVSKSYTAFWEVLEGLADFR